MTRLLLDTCVLIDWATDPRRIKNNARLAIANPRSQVYVSAISAFEIVIKQQLGKLTAPSDIQKLLAANRFVELPVTVHHAESLAGVPPLHKDPFDRLLIGQAICEQLTLVTRDSKILAYDVATLAA